MSDDPFLEIEAAALRMLAVREHSRAELEHKLIMKGHLGEAVQRVLDDLEQRRLLSDERFTDQYVAMRKRKGYGPLRIRAELRERGVASELVTTMLDEAGHDWRKLLREVRLGRFGDRPMNDRKEMARQARFLAQRGFPESLVREALLDDTDRS